MRLVCPNCAAQYEVDDSAIPEGGRDVQCASCGDTWFQEPLTGDGPDMADPGKAEMPFPDPGIPAESATVGAAPDARPQPRPARKAHDMSVLDILRREAEREQKARDLESRQQVTPPANGDGRTAEKADRHTPSPEADSRLSMSPQGKRPSPEKQSAQPPDAGAPVPGPTVEDVSTGGKEDIPSPATEEGAEAHTGPGDIGGQNAALRAAGNKTRRNKQPRNPRKTESMDPGGDADRRAGRRGFYFAMLLFLVLLVAYLMKAKIISAAPGTAPFLELYTEMVDAGRHALANGVSALISAGRGLSGK